MWMRELTTKTITADSRIGSQSASNGVIVMKASWLWRVLVTGGMVAGALEREEFVNRRDRCRVAAANAYFPAPRAIDHFVLDARVVLPHDGGAGHDLGVDLEGLREVAGPERG